MVRALDKQKTKFRVMDKTSENFKTASMDILHLQNGKS
ncbi:unnamed protein product [Acanthoscelides obtectus]|uniref:Uncharacterized protein n=1 Tax=Acanthoscelides obtectus TaxID=200917 RepID=A0A9P0MD22_ACAOB|nr:unnamed protein product [Acanthoscelides obtectus]CAK1647561.1 hypothetical protein AOBTE_LOCUS15269 [Acanthoscelides obtectus]